MPPFNRSVAAVVGIDAYCGDIPRLRTAVADARRLARVLTDSHGYECRLLTEDVTLDRLRDLLRELREGAGRLGADDRLLFYFAGHGIALDGDDGPSGYLVPQYARRDDRSTFLPMSELHDSLAELPCRHLLVVLDCCFAGAFRWSSTRNLSSPPAVVYRERYDRYVRDRAWQVITSAAYDQEALDVLASQAQARESGSDHSPFAAALFRGLAGEADLISRAKDGKPVRDGVITAAELYLFLRECVELGAEEIGRRQTPGLWPLKKHDKGEYIILVPGHELNLPPAPELNDQTNPYRGLQSFEEEHSQLFFGRAKLVGLLAGRVAAQSLTVVLGASGTGKSSVVKAGLLPHLRGVSGEVWQIAAPVRPGKSPLRTLAGLELPGEVTIEAPERLVGAWTDPRALAARVRAWAVANSGERLLLVIDQLEELITQCWDGWERNRFVEQLELALEAHPDQLRIVLTLRSDFEPQFAGCAFKNLWMGSRLVVPPLTQDELREAIEGPASARVLYFDPPGLVDDLINDVVQTPGALPLLSFTLRELYVKYICRHGADRAMSGQDYRELGGVGGSLRNRATEEYEGLPDEAHRATMRRIMLRMVSIEGGELARRRVPRSELVYADTAENARVAEVLDRLTKVRLVVIGSEADGEAFAEPAHDELVRGWDRLLQWARQEQEQSALRRLLTPAANDWRGGKGGLWHANPRLKLLQRVRRSPASWLNFIEGEFVWRSALRRKNILGGSAAFVVVVILSLAGLTLYAFSERDRANSKTGEAIAEEVKARRQTASLLTREAMRREDEGNHAAALHYYAAAVAKIPDVPEDQLANRIRMGLRLRPGPYLRAIHDLGWGVFSPDGGRYITTADFGSLFSKATAADLWDPLSGERIATLEGHEFSIGDFAFSEDSSLVAVIPGKLKGNKVRIWDGRTGKALAKLTVGPGELVSAKFSRDGRLLAVIFSAEWLKEGPLYPVRLYDWAAGKLLCNLTGHSSFVRDVAVDVQAGRIVTASADRSAIIWDVRTGERVRTLQGHRSDVDSVHLSPDGTRALTSGNLLAPTSILWDLASGNKLFELPGNRGRHTPDGQWLLTVENDSGLVSLASGQGSSEREAPATKVWKASTGELIATLPGSLRGLSPDGRAALTDLGNGTLRTYSIPEGSVLATLQGHGGRVHAAFSPDGMRILVRGANGSVRLWDAFSRVPVMSFREDGDTQLTANGLRTFTATAGGMLLVRDIRDGSLLALVNGVKPPVQPGTESILTSTFPNDPDRRLVCSSSADGSRVAFVGEDKTVRVWDVGKASLLCTLRDSRDGAFRWPFRDFDLAYGWGLTPDGRFVIMSASNGLTAWDAATGKPLAALEGGLSTLRSMAFGKDGRLVFAADDNAKRVWELPSGRLLANLEDQFQHVYHSDFNWDGTRVVTAPQDNIVRVCDAKTGKVEVRYTGHQGSITDVHVSPDGQLVATCSDDQTVHLWEMATGKTVHVLGGHGSRTTCAAFSSDQHYVATANGEGTVFLWDTATGTLLDRLKGPSGGVHQLSFVPDGDRVVSRSAEGEVHCWNLNPLSISAAHLELLTEVSTGTTPDPLNVTGVRGLSAAEWQDRRKRLVEVMASGCQNGEAALGVDQAATLLRFSPNPVAARCLANVLRDKGILNFVTAAEGLLSAGGGAAALSTALLEAIRDSPGYSLAIAARSLERLGGAALRPLLDLFEERLRKGEVVERREVTDALGRLRIETGSAAPILAVALRDKDVTVRRLAAGILARPGRTTQPVVAALIDSLSDEDDIVRGFAANALGYAGRDSREAAAALIEAMRRKKLGKDAAHALSQLGQEAVPALVAALGAADGGARDQLTSALAMMGPSAVAPLMKALASDQPSVRAGAAGALGHLGPTAKPAIEALVEAMGAPDRDTRVEAGMALAHIGGDAVPSLTKALKHPSNQVRANAAAVLGQVGLTQYGPNFAKNIVLYAAIPALVEAAQDVDETVCANAAQALRWIGAEDAIPLLIELARQKDEDTRLRAVQALGRLYANADPPRVQSRTGMVAGMALTGLAERLEKDPSSRVRSEVARALGNLLLPTSFLTPPEPVEAAKSALRRTLKAEEPRLRLDAAGALVAIWDRNEDVVLVLTEMLKQPVPEIRLRAVSLLGQIGEPAKSATSALASLLRDGEPRVGVSAACALARIRAENEATAFVLIKGLHAQELEVRILAAQGLWSIGKEARRALPALRAALEAENERLRVLAAATVVRIDPAETVASQLLRESAPMLIKLLEPSFDPEWRIFAAEALGLLGPKVTEAIPALERLSLDHDIQLRAASEAALEQIRGAPGRNKSAPH